MRIPYQYIEGWIFILSDGTYRRQCKHKANVAPLLQMVA